jgi:hypothetical protein
MRMQCKPGLVGFEVLTAVSTKMAVSEVLAASIIALMMGDGATTQKTATLIQDCY